LNIMRRYRNAKIVATLGPASDSPETIRALFEAGADVFRLNFSHGTHDGHARRIAAIRALEAETGRPIGILTDLQGPKLRIGDLEGGETELAAGDAFRFDLSQAPGDATRVSLPHPEVFAALREGTEILLDDGRLRLRVTSCAEDYAETEILAGGTLSDHKGVNVPNVVLGITPLGDKDREDLKFALDQGVDWIGLSFVQRPEDVAAARELVGDRAALISKLEKPAAIQHLEEIVALSDAVMVARGDLGVELPPEDVPSVQKQIIHACRPAGKPVVVATQMLESMIHAPAPTRAEASDVATAIYEGADAVMLSAETAAGEYPVESVAMMDRIVARVEKDPLFRGIMDATHEAPEATAPDAITAAARQVARTVSAAAIVTYTTSGSTSLRAARERPDVPVLCLTERPETARKLAMAWGLQCIIAQDVQNFDDMVNKACRVARDADFAGPGDRLVITAGVPFGTPGATNILRIATLDD
jgi:pyruvate kinase